LAGNKNTSRRLNVLLSMRHARGIEMLKSAQAKGTEGYIWRTMQDDLVRDSHEVLEDHFFTWDDPPVINEYGTRGHPGMDYNCRCHAEPFTKEEQPTEEPPHRPAGRK